MLQASDSHLALGRAPYARGTMQGVLCQGYYGVRGTMAPYVVHGVRYIALVPFAPFSIASTCNCFNRYFHFLPSESKSHFARCTLCRPTQNVRLGSPTDRRRGPRAKRASRAHRACRAECGGRWRRASLQCRRPQRLHDWHGHEGVVHG